MGIEKMSDDGLEFREGYAGGCYVNGTATCVSEPEDYCDEGTFVMASYVRANKGHPLRYCAGELENVVIGRCGDSGECSNTPYGCEDEETWDEHDETCTVTRDLGNAELAYVTYGKCGDRCVWSPDDCMEGEDYVRKSPECTADKVQIGACFDGFAFCAVSADSCTQSGLADEPFYTHRQIQEWVGAGCFLSSLPLPAETSPQPTREPWNAMPAVAPTPSAFSPVDVGTTAPEQSSNDNGIFGSPWKLSSGVFQTGGFVAMVAVVAIILGIIIGVSAVYCSRKDDDSWKADKEHPPVPTEIIDPRPDVEYAASSITDYDVGY